MYRLQVVVIKHNKFGLESQKHQVEEDRLLFGNHILSENKKDVR